MGLILRFGPYPTPLNVTDNGLATALDVFDSDFLLALATALVLPRSREIDLNIRHQHRVANSSFQKSDKLTKPAASAYGGAKRGSFTAVGMKS